MTVGLAAQILAGEDILPRNSIEIACENGAIKLEPLLNMTEPKVGFIQHCMGKKWSMLCGRLFRVEANVVCRQLGYSDYGKVWYGS